MKENRAIETRQADPLERQRNLYIGATISVVAMMAAVLIQKTYGWEHLVGSFLLTAMLLFIVYRDILRYQPQYLKKKRMLILLGVLFILTLALGRLTEFTLEGLLKGLEIEGGDAVQFAVPVAAGAMLIMLLFDFHTAIISSFVLSLLMGLWQGNATFTIYSFIGSLTAAFTIIGCKRRTAILRSGAFIFAANFLTVIVIMLFNGVIFTSHAPVALVFALVNSILVVAIVSLTLPLFESMFKVTTNISLLELLDLDHPLMKNLMIEAPGTYHHSIIVGNLVEACADLVGVNPLLARVGAYYHDIGKARMPDYFIENQAMGVSKHEKLTAHMSSMILISHVKEGVEMGIQHKLPEEIIDIIKEHHGDTLITYFYQKAKGELNGEDLSEDIYRYPGPKPQTRTAALIMMADAVEAASRVLHDPTPARITALVDKIINHIFLARQLEECELTLKDISEIRNRFSYILTGIMHKRIEYPGFNFNEKDNNDQSNSKKHTAEGLPQHTGDRAGISKSSPNTWS
ncbi:HD family phosphohydrolase [Nitrospirota bacterium]